MRDAQQQRVLERLRSAHGNPVTFADLRLDGIEFPAAIVSELELSGYVIDRVYDHGKLVGVRLLEPPESEVLKRPSPHRPPWRHR